MWISGWRLPLVRAELEDELGPLAVLHLATAQAVAPTVHQVIAQPPTASETAATPTPNPVAIAGMSDANKLALRARLQVGRAAPRPEAAQIVDDGYGVLMHPATLLRAVAPDDPYSAFLRLLRAGPGPIIVANVSPTAATAAGPAIWLAAGMEDVPPLRM